MDEKRYVNAVARKLKMRWKKKKRDQKAASGRYSGAEKSGGTTGRYYFPDG